VVSINVGKRTITVRCNADDSFQKEKYKLSDEGKEWRWPKADSTESAPTQEEGLDDKREEDGNVSAGRGNAETAEAVAAPLLLSASPAAIVGGHEIKDGMVVECAFQDDDSDKIDWIGGLVIAVNTKSQKFKVRIRVEREHEQGQWNETFKVWTVLPSCFPLYILFHIYTLRHVDNLHCALAVFGLRQ
jgi:hypothetical protein